MSAIMRNISVLASQEAVLRARNQLQRLLRTVPEIKPEGAQPDQVDDASRQPSQCSEEELQATLNEICESQKELKKSEEALAAAQVEARRIAEEERKRVEAACKAKADASIPENKHNFKELRAALHRCSLAQTQVMEGKPQAIQQLEIALRAAQAAGADPRQLGRFKQTLLKVREVFEVCVRTLSGDEIRVDVAEFHSVGEFRERVASGLGWDQAATRLFLEDVQLFRDQDTIKMYGVNPGNNEVFAKLLIDEVEHQSGEAKACVDSAMNDLVATGARPQEIQCITATMAMDTILRDWTRALINAAAGCDAIDLSQIALLLQQLDDGICSDENAREIVRLYADGAKFVRDIDEEYTRKVASEKDRAMAVFEVKKKHIEKRNDQEYWATLYGEQNRLGAIRMSQFDCQPLKSTRCR